MEVTRFQVIGTDRYQPFQATFGFAYAAGLRQQARLCQVTLPIPIAVG